MARSLWEKFGSEISSAGCLIGRSGAVGSVSGQPSPAGCCTQVGSSRGKSVALRGLQTSPPRAPGVHGGALGDGVCLSEIPYYTRSCRRLKQQNCTLRKAPAKSS